ncbi:nuclear transport factor 2 family protein [Streptomyces sp. NBC_01728]|uniref:nuclear transport factor 2 family protein n=1 Tax=unclassified Streptomyces TaxID=2593676 RepID=UPI00225ACAB4|nr:MULTISPECIES: nuclear transport factor 2 family protein [unclassified Streptomyces]MCX4461751.1 nuclear transport factor 2 family protein [Streptomyces sp. NBC_01719]MCX4490660.1 nuclear transport factor 2 family protein [Streptomyces sp. NBC_01728]
MTVEGARRISAPLYEALNKPSEKNVSELLAQAGNDDYHSYHTNQEFLTRDQLADVFEAMGETVPDLAWEVVDIHVVDDTMIVRGEATGRSKNFGALLRPESPSGRWRLTYSPSAMEGWRRATTSRIGRRRSNSSTPDPGSTGLIVV